MRGRKPKPTVLHHLHGTFNATDHRDRALEPVAFGELLTPPRDLTRAQRAAWKYAIEHAPRGVLKRIDRETLRAWVETLVRRHQAQKQLAAETDPLAWEKSRCHGILDRTTVLMIRLAAELGFTPAARPRLRTDAPAAEADNPWAQFKLIPGGRD